MEENLAGCYQRFRASHAASGLPVDVHCFLGVRAEVLQDLDGRIERMKALQLPGLVRPLGHTHVEGSVLLVTDIVDGVRLDQLLRQVDPLQARHWADSLSAMLGALHGNGELHGRLCPQSIYIGPDGPRITGAGISDLWEPVWTATDPQGELPPRLFTPLEVRLDGVKEATPAADVFGLGTILYHGYTSVFPGEFCPLPSDRADVPRCVDGAVMAAMHPDAASRQQSMEEFIEEFTGVRERAGADWRPQSTGEEEAGASQPHWLDGKGAWIGRLPIYAAGAAALALIGWQGIQLTKKKRDDEPAQVMAPAVEEPAEPEAEPKAKTREVSRPGRVAELVRYADLAAGRHDWFLEWEALKQACAIAPGERELRERLAGNPWQLRADIREAIGLLKISNPEQVEWKILADFEPGGCRLDLSGNEELQHIAPLLEQRLWSLDLSGTKVKDLGPLAEKPPRELRILDTPVEGLGEPDFAGTLVTTREDKPRASGGMFWENLHGMRFAPVPGSEVLLARREVTLKQFMEFAAAEGGSFGKGMLSLREGEWQAAGHDWKDPGFEVSPQHPVVGVTLEEAERFCAWLTKAGLSSGDLVAGQFYRLPSDYEWGTAAGFEEHALLRPASRDQTNLAKTGPDQLKQLRLVEGYGEASGTPTRLQPVAQGAPDGAFFDLLGNAAEWCRADRLAGETAVVARGIGGARQFHAAGTCRQDIGFRVVLDLGSGGVPALNEATLADSDWQSIRGRALDLAFDASNFWARESGRAFLETGIRFEQRDRQDDLDPILSGVRDGRRYQLVRLPVSWATARRIARDAGGRLAGGDDLALLRWLAEIDREAPVAIWLGARFDGDVWMWENGASAKQVALPEIGGASRPGLKPSDYRIAMSSDHQLVARPESEPTAFIIEWGADRAGADVAAKSEAQ